VIVIDLPDPSLVVLIGAAGSGKSTFAARHFVPAEILSSDAFRAAIAGDAADQAANGPAFAALHASLERRLRTGRLTVVDATNLMSAARRVLLAKANEAGVPAVAIVLDLPVDVVLRRNAARADRVVPDEVVRRHLGQIRRLVDDAALDGDGFRQIVIMRDTDDVEAIEIRRVTGLESAL
jgi:protein phosphatase